MKGRNMKRLTWLIAILLVFLLAPFASAQTVVWNPADATQKTAKWYTPLAKGITLKAGTSVATTTQGCTAIGALSYPGFGGSVYGVCLPPKTGSGVTPGTWDCTVIGPDYVWDYEGKFCHIPAAKPTGTPGPTGTSGASGPPCGGTWISPTPCPTGPSGPAPASVGPWFVGMIFPVGSSVPVKGTVTVLDANGKTIYSGPVRIVPFNP